MIHTSSVSAKLSKSQLKDPRAKFLYKYGIQNIPLDAFLKESARRNPVVWGQLFRQVRGRPYVFQYKKNPHFFRPWLKQPMKDQTPHKAIKKGRQIGATELGTTEFLWFLDVHDNTKGVYVFPTGGLLSRFVRTRVEDAILASEYLRSRVRELNNVQQKKIGKSFAIFSSAGAQRLGEGTDADIVVLDEKDRMNDRTEVAFRETLSASRYGYIREYSTPTIPNFGIAKSFTNSCRYHYFLRCEACGCRQALSYPENIKQVKDYDETLDIVPEGCFIIACVKCNKELNRMQIGEWVAERPDLSRYRAGYFISQLYAPWISASRIMEKRREYPFVELWYNYVIGVEHVGDNIPIHEDDILECQDKELTWQTKRDEAYVAVVAGIDWGAKNWAVVVGIRPDGSTKLLNWFVAQDSKKGNPLGSVMELDEKMAPFQPNVIVADAGYGKDRVAYLQKKYPGRVYACFYKDSRSKKGKSGDKLVQPKWNFNDWSVSVNRTSALKSYFQTFKSEFRSWVVPRNDQKLKTFISHHTALAILREEEEDAEGNKTGEIIERIVRTRDDHLAHAGCYARLARDLVVTGGKITSDRLDFGFVDQPPGPSIGSSTPTVGDFLSIQML